MAFNSNGQIQYLILSSLEDGSKYGLEIIEYISKTTGGNYIMKKPTLYSCLSRMEKKGLVSSSFWGESELGGKRHYYSITDEGRASLKALASEFANAPITPQTFQNEQQSAPQSDSASNDLSENKTETYVLQQDNLFDMVSEKPQKAAEPEKTTQIDENQIDIFSYVQKQEEVSQHKEEEKQEQADEEKLQYYKSILEQSPVKDDAKFLDSTERLSTEEEAQNKRLYDTSNDLKRYRKRKSFAENQIEMEVVYENEDDLAAQRERIEQLKASLLGARTNAQQSLQQETEENTSTASSQTYQTSLSSQTSSIAQSMQNASSSAAESDVPVRDDAIFITERVEESEIPIQRKITPPNIEIDVTDDNLPAPKRNANLEPTYKDMMSKLFEQKKEKKAEPVQTAKPEVEAQTTENISSFGDYASLQKYYSQHGISFREYKQTNVQRHHNTNFLLFVSSTILLLLASVGSAILFGIISAAKCLSPSSNFLYYVVPILFLLYTLFTLLRHKLFASKKASIVYNGFINWAVFALASVVIVVVNVFCGMQVESISKFLTSILVPIYAVLLALPVNFHIKKFLFKRYAK